MENTVILTVCADNSKLTLLWVSLFVEYLCGVYMTPFSTQKQTVGHHFGLSALSIAYLWRIQWYWILTLYVLIILNWLCYECRFFVEYMAAFTWFHFQHKKEHLVTVLSFRLHANDENAYSKPETFESGDLSGDLENGYLKNGWLFMCKHPKMNTYFWYRHTLAFILARKVSKSPTLTSIDTKLHFLQHIVLNFECLPKMACPHSTCIINFRS